MTSAAWPTVIAAVMSTATAVLPTARVVRGRDSTDDFGNLVMVGVADLNSGGWDNAGDYQQTMQTFGGRREEKGTVNGFVMARNGDDDLAGAEEAAFAMIAALEASIATSPALGVVSLDYLVAEIDSGSVQELASDAGANAALSFVITYRARI
jgi:hypothetical protein